MKPGKLDWNELKGIIDEYTSVKRSEVRIGSGIGEDCAVIDFGENECVLSTDPITGAIKNIGALAVNINCNDAAACGVEPLGILVTILVPVSSSMEEIRNIMSQINEETKKLNVQILGGHTEVTEAVNKPIVACTVIGKCPSGAAVASSGAKVGDDIIVTKELCLEGTSIVINDYMDIVKKFLSDEEIKEGLNYSSSFSVVKEGKISGKFGAHSMHDITEGGVLGALWEIAEGSNVGFKVYQDKMPITLITRKICSALSIEPLKFISSGSMLISTDNGEELVRQLKDEGIKASIVGKITKSKGIIIKDRGEELVVPPERDELFNINIKNVEENYEKINCS